MAPNWLLLFPLAFCVFGSLQVMAKRKESKEVGAEVQKVVRKLLEDPALVKAKNKRKVTRSVLGVIASARKLLDLLTMHKAIFSLVMRVVKCSLVVTRLVLKLAGKFFPVSVFVSGLDAVENIVKLITDITGYGNEDEEGDGDDEEGDDDDEEENDDEEDDEEEEDIGKNENAHSKAHKKLEERKGKALKKKEEKGQKKKQSAQKKKEHGRQKTGEGKDQKGQKRE